MSKQRSVYSLYSKQDDLIMIKNLQILLHESLSREKDNKKQMELLQQQIVHDKQVIESYNNKHQANKLMLKLKETTYNSITKKISQMNIKEMEDILLDKLNIVQQENKQLKEQLQIGPEIVSKTLQIEQLNKKIEYFQNLFTKNRILNLCLRQQEEEGLEEEEKKKKKKKIQIFPHQTTLVLLTTLLLTLLMTQTQ